MLVACNVSANAHMQGAAVVLVCMTVAYVLTPLSLQLQPAVTCNHTIANESNLTSLNGADTPQTIST